MDEQEEEFIRRINNKEEKGYRELFKRYYRYLVVVARRYIQDPDDAEDIVQDALLNLWQSTKQFNSTYGLQQYLYTAVKNGCLRHLQRKRSEQQYCEEMRLTATEAEENIEDYEHMREEIRRRVHQAIDELPEGCRKILREHLAGKKNEEIAALFQLSIETVKNQKKNAMRLLHGKLGDVYGLMLFIAFNV